MSDKFLIVILCFFVLAGVLIGLTTTSNTEFEDMQILKVFTSTDAQASQKVANN